MKIFHFLSHALATAHIHLYTSKINKTKETCLSLTIQELFARDFSAELEIMGTDLIFKFKKASEDEQRSFGNLDCYSNFKVGIFTTAIDIPMLFSKQGRLKINFGKKVLCINISLEYLWLANSGLQFAMSYLYNEIFDKCNLECKDLIQLSKTIIKKSRERLSNNGNYNMREISYRLDELDEEIYQIQIKVGKLYEVSSTFKFDKVIDFFDNQSSCDRLGYMEDMLLDDILKNINCIEKKFDECIEILLEATVMHYEQNKLSVLPKRDFPDQNFYTIECKGFNNVINPINRTFEVISVEPENNKLSRENEFDLQEQHYSKECESLLDDKETPCNSYFTGESSYQNDNEQEFFCKLGFEEIEYRGLENEVQSKDAALEDTALEDTTMKDTALEDTTMKDTALKDTTMKDTALKDTTMKDTALKDTALKDTALKDTALKDTALKDLIPSAVHKVNNPFNDDNYIEDLTNLDMPLKAHNDVSLKSPDKERSYDTVSKCVRNLNTNPVIEKNEKLCNPLLYSQRRSRIDLRESLCSTELLKISISSEDSERNIQKNTNLIEDKTSSNNEIINLIEDKISLIEMTYLIKIPIFTFKQKSVNLLRLLRHSIKNLFTTRNKELDNQIVQEGVIKRKGNKHKKKQKKQSLNIKTENEDLKVDNEEAIQYCQLLLFLCWITFFYMVFDLASHRIVN